VHIRLRRLSNKLVSPRSPGPAISSGARQVQIPAKVASMHGILRPTSAQEGVEVSGELAVVLEEKSVSSICVDL
jgi:hypothetical protein